MKTQETKWLQKIDEVREQNKPKDEEDIGVLKKQYNLTEENQYEVLNTELIPLHLVDYETQCRIKRRRLELFLGQFVEKIADYSSTVILDADGKPCVFHDLIRSDLVNEYQSQNSFQMYLDVNGQLAVGLMMGNFKTQRTCVRPLKFTVCKQSHRSLAGRFEEYLKTKSHLAPILDFKSGEGHWIEFFVRSNREGEHQCLATLDNRDLSKEQLAAECDLIREHFQVDGLNVKSFDLEIKSSQKKEALLAEPGRVNWAVEPGLVHVFGDHHLPVTLNDLVYHIRVKSLFPTNVEVYGKIIDSLLENLDLTSANNLLFVEPHGGLGLPRLAKTVNRLFVVCKNETQSNDCRRSIAHLKGQQKIEFSSGHPMKAIFKVLDGNKRELCVIIRQSDMSPQIVNELRNNPRVSKIALISTRPQEELLKIWVQLCLDNRNTSITGNPFSFICATPCDTHPHSNLYTIVSVFERVLS